MMKPLIAGLLVASFSINAAVAGDYHHDRPSKSYYSYQKNDHKRYGISYDQGHKNSFGKNENYAKVISVNPITRTLTRKIPEETCWNETVRYSERQSSSATPAIVGGIIGATLGHSLGSSKNKSNRNVKTIALGALGASIGHDIGRKNSSQNVRYGTEQRCQVSYHTRYEEEIVAYDVRYRYRGKTYHTQMDYHPGDSIPVQVNVRPIL